MLTLSQSKEVILIAYEGKLGMYGVGEPLHVPVVPSELSGHALVVVVALIQEVGALHTADVPGIVSMIIKILKVMNKVTSK